MASNEGRWTKWWWLAYFSVNAPTWTAVERNVRIALGMTALAVFLIINFPIDAILNLIGIERHYAAVLAGAVSVVLAFFAARPIAVMLYPGPLRKADENSQRRLRAP